MSDLSAAVIRRMGQETLPPIRDVAIEICPHLIGRKYDDLDPVEEPRLIFDIFAIASRLLYVRLGVDTRCHPKLADVVYFPFILAKARTLYILDNEVGPAPKPERQPRFPHLVGKGIMYGDAK